MSYQGNISAGYYNGQRARSWQDDTVNDKPVLKVYFDVQGEEISWTCWPDMQNQEGEPSANLKGLIALGATLEDIERWAKGGELEGLDRNEVSLKVEMNKNGWPLVKYVNEPRAMREAQPLGAKERSDFARSIYAAMKKAGAPAAAPKVTRTDAPKGDDEIPF